MKIHGREVGLLKTVGAVCEISEMCPEKKLNNVKLLFQGDDIADRKNMIALVCALNKGYESAKKFEDHDYKPNFLTEEECMSIDESDFMMLFDEAIRVFYNIDQTVEVEEPKKKEEINETSD